MMAGWNMRDDSITFVLAELYIYIYICTLIYEFLTVSNMALLKLCENRGMEPCLFIHKDTSMQRSCSTSYCMVYVCL
jgi:hypothetical protein